MIVWYLDRAESYSVQKTFIHSRDCVVHVVERSVVVDRDVLASRPLVQPDDASVSAVDIPSMPRGKVNTFFLSVPFAGRASDLFLLSHVVQFDRQLQLTLSFTFHCLALFLIEMFFAQRVQCLARIFQLVEFILQGLVVR